jgi:hypothetical protein
MPHRRSGGNRRGRTIPAFAQARKPLNSPTTFVRLILRQPVHRLCSARSPHLLLSGTRPLRRRIQYRPCRELGTTNRRGYSRLKKRPAPCRRPRCAARIQTVPNMRAAPPVHSQGFEIRTFFTIGRQDTPYYM